jgi:AraC-like DNA-binding protein
MGYSTENLSNANLCLYHFVATFLFPDKHINEKKRRRDMIHEIILFMKSNISERLTIDDLAAQSNFCVSHFTSLFRKGTGMSPLDYFIHLKLQRACLLLHTTDNKISAIAAELGYDDPYYFSRLFKKYMKASPDHYRIAVRKTDQTYKI